MFRKKIETFSVDYDWNKSASFCETHPVQVMPFLSSKFLIFLDTLSCFASVGWRVLKCSKIVSRSKVGSFYP